MMRFQKLRAGLLATASGAFAFAAVPVIAAETTVAGASAINGMNTGYLITAPDVLILDATGVGGNRAADSMGAAIAKSGGDLTISGSGTLRVTGGGGDVLGIADTPGRTVNISLGSGGLIDIQGGAFTTGGWGGGVWSANLADMTIAAGAVFDVWDGGNIIRVDALNGAGAVQNGSNNPGLRSLVIGVDGGSGSFSGIIGGGTGRVGDNQISLTKEGAGTQILVGNNTYAGTTAINGGTLQIGDGGTTGSPGSGNVSITGTLVFNRSNNHGTGSGQVFSGAGTIRKEGAGELVFNGGVDHTNVQAITTLEVNDGLVRTDNWGLWNSGLALTVNGPGVMEMWNGNLSLGSLNGNGIVRNTVKWNRPAPTLTIAAGFFSGTISDNGVTSGGVPAGDTRIHLIKTGAGTLTLSGTTAYTGNTTVEEGTLSLGNGVAPTGLSDEATFDIASGAVVDLNFAGTDTVGKLVIDGVTVPAGVYDGSLSTPAEFRGYFTGSGALRVLGENGVWISTTDGTWSDGANWQDGVAAVGTDKTATFSAGGAPVVVTLDSARIIGNLSFSNTDYTIDGTSTLTLESTGSASSIMVEAGTSAWISAPLAGSPDINLSGGGTLVLGGANSFTGFTTLDAGALELRGAAISNFRSPVIIGAGAKFRLTGDNTPYVGGNYNQLALGSSATAGSFSITGAGGLVVNGFVALGNAAAAPLVEIAMDSGALIDIQSGALVNGGWSRAVWSANLADMHVAAGAAFDIWDGRPVVIDALTGSGSIRNGSNDLSLSNRILTVGVDNGSSTFDGVIGGGMGGGANASADRIAITKAGTGSLTLTGSNTYLGDTIVQDGTLGVTTSGSLRFRPTINGSSNRVTGSSSATLAYLGGVDLDLSGADATTGNAWTLVDLSSFSGPVPVFNPNAVSSGLGDFTEVASGVWELGVTGGKWVFTEATGTLAYQISASDYETWADSFAPPIGAGELDDDGDGVNNFEEYAFGLLPNSAASVNPITAPLDKGTGRFTYRRRSTPETTGLVYSYEYSTSLTGTWPPFTPVVAEQTDSGSPVEEVTVTVPTELLANPDLFIRVKVE